jgi:hypothetical protein
MKITKSKLKQIIKEELAKLAEGDDEMELQPAAGPRGRGWSPGDMEHGRDSDRQTTPEHGMTLREPWDGIEENAGMIGDNALKIEYLARAMGVEIPIDLSYPQGPKGRLEEDWTDDSGKRHRGPAPPGHWKAQKEKESRDATKKGKKDPHRPDPRRG